MPDLKQHDNVKHIAHWSSLALRRRLGPNLGPFGRHDARRLARRHRRFLLPRRRQRKKVHKYIFTKIMRLIIEYFFCETETKWISLSEVSSKSHSRGSQTAPATNKQAPFTARVIVLVWPGLPPSQSH